MVSSFSDSSFTREDLYRLLNERTSEIAQLKAECERLRDWKAAALQLESEWDEQAVGKALDLPLGTSIRAGILPAISTLKARIQQLEADSGLLEAENALARSIMQRFQSWLANQKPANEWPNDVVNSIMPLLRVMSRTQPEQPTEPGEGWRILEPEEEPLRDGDEYRLNGEWYPLFAESSIVGLRRIEGVTYRRRITAKGEM